MHWYCQEPLRAKIKFGLYSQEQFSRTVQNGVDDVNDDGDYDDDDDNDDDDDAHMENTPKTPFFKYSQEPLLTIYKPLGYL